MTNDLGFQVRDKLILLAEAQKLDLYGSKPVSIPRPELYMVYTGAPRQLPEILRLSDMYGGPGGAETEIKVLKNTGAGNIVDQYIRFCEISDEQRKQYGYTIKAAEETLRICENILMPFLTLRQKEVQDIMVTLFNQERVTEIHEYNLVKDARQEGRIETAKSLMNALNLPVDQVLAALKIPKKEHEIYRKLLDNQ